MTHIHINDQKVDNLRNEKDRLHQRIAELEYAASIGNTLIQHFPQGYIIIYDQDLRYVATHCTAEAHAGLSDEAMIGRTIQEVLPPDICALLEPHYRATLEGQTGNVQVTFAERTFDVHLLPVSNEQGDVTHGMVVIYDVTTRLIAEASMRENEYRLQNLMNHVPATIFLKDTQRRYVLINDYYKNLLQLGRDEVIGRTNEQIAAYMEEKGLINSPDERQFIQQSVAHWQREDQAVLNTGKTIEVEETASVAGEMRSYFAIKFPFYDEQGSIVGLGGISTDITERKKMEEALRTSETQLQAIFDHTLVAVGLMDIQWRYIKVNRRWADMLGYTLEEIYQSKALDVTHPDDVEISRMHQQKLSRGLIDSYRLEKRFVRKDRSVFWGDVLVTLIRDGWGEPTLIIGTVSDITERKQAETALQHAHADLINRTRELEQRNREITLLSSMSDLLQTCRTDQEAAAVISEIMPHMFPGTSGALYALSASHSHADAIASWGNLATQPVCAPGECWAFRRGRVHLSQDTTQGLVCEHLAVPRPQSAMCIPMIAQGEILGILHLCRQQEPFIAATRQLAVTVAEHMSLALANIRLRETLRHQAIRDPLTGLYNRRYMEESLEREIQRANRHHTSLGVVMLDLDHFKQFNDTFGHAAGDLLLRELGTLLQAHLRREDIACRYGGEEFTLIVLDAAVDAIKRRADQIRMAIKQLAVFYRGQTLGAVTVSMGIAMFPAHGTTGDILMWIADRALYMAKAYGRDQVVVGLDSRP